MNRKTIVMTLVAVLCMTCLLATMNSSEGASETQDGSPERPFLKSVSIPKGGAKVAYVSLNPTAFEFFQTDDGISIGYGIPNQMRYVNQKITEESKPALQEWVSDSFHPIGNMNVRVLKVDDTGIYGFEIKLTGTLSSAVYFDAYFTICSHGVSQTTHYKFNVIEDSTTTYSLTFSDVTIDSDGLFSSQGTLLVDGKSADLSNYALYATGLYPGITIHNDQSITDRAEIGSSKRADGTQIDFKVTVYDISNKSLVTVDSTIKYSIRPPVPTLNFNLSSESDILLTDSSIKTEISVLSGTDLILNVGSGTEATVIYTDETSQVSTRTIHSTASTPGKLTLDTSGNGSYMILLSKSESTALKIVTVDVVGSLTALNSIYVTCAPL